MGAAHGLTRGRRRLKAYSGAMFVPHRPRPSLPHALLLVSGLVGAVVAMPAYADRPRSVDTAVVAPKGSMRVETWYTRGTDRQNSLTVAPFWTPIDTLEVGGLASRNTTSDLTRTSMQLKWAMTPEQRDGCQLGSVLGVGRTLRQGPNQGYFNAIMSCNDTNGAMHFNVGRIRPDGGPSATTWGVSIEIPDGRYTGYAEAFGQRGTSAQETTTYQLGLRAVLSPRWQVDGTWGRVRETRENLYSVGVAYRF